MSRIRTIKPTIWKHEDLCALPFECRLLFIGLWNLADREGRLPDRPRWIKAELFPYDELDMSAMLHSLSVAGFIHRYAAGAHRYVQVVNFLKHQRPNNKEPQSEIPPPEHALSESKHRLTGKEGNGVGEGKGESGSAAPPSAATPTLADEGGSPSRTDEGHKQPVTKGRLVFPTVGSGAREWALTDGQISDWSTLYPALNVLAEAQKALAWLVANPGRRKTTAGMPRFLVNWLNRANDSGGAMTARRLVNQAPPPREDDDWFAECKRLHDFSCGSRNKHGLRMKTGAA